MDLRRGSASAGWRPLKRRKSVPKSVRAGLQFPVARIARRLREGRYAKRLGSTAPVFLASVLEYLTAEVLEMAGNCAERLKKKRINPRHLMLAIKGDEDVAKVLSDAIIPGAGAVPHVHKELERKSTVCNKPPKPSQAEQRQRAKDQAHKEEMIRRFAQAREAMEANRRRLLVEVAKQNRISKVRTSSPSSKRIYLFSP